MIYYHYSGGFTFNIPFIRTICLRVLQLFAIVLISCEKTVFIDNPPQLEITVLDESGNRVQDANVTLYGSEEDWKAKSTALQSELTNSQGVVLFENLEEQIYFFYAQKDKLSNEESISALDKELQFNIKALITTIIK